MDRFRREGTLARRYAEIGHDLRVSGSATVSQDVDAATFADDAAEDIDDDLLRLMFTACHPVLGVEARVALAGRARRPATAEIAAYLVPEATVAQRIVRAKRTIARAGVPFEVPVGEERGRRLSSVLEVLYVIFNEGYSATVGEDWLRPALCADAVRLGRVLAQLTPDEPEVLGLVALMEIQSSRTAARTGPSGEPVLLLDQNRARWDRLLINRGLDALARAEELGGERGPYVLQASIAACHARAVRAGDTDWVRIAALYAVLADVAPSPVVELNRAVAVSMAEGPAAGLDVVDALRDEPTLRGYHLLSSVRGDLLLRLGRPAEASVEFARAASLTGNARERQLSEQRARAAAEAGAG